VIFTRNTIETKKLALLLKKIGGFSKKRSTSPTMVFYVKKVLENDLPLRSYGCEIKSGKGSFISKQEQAHLLHD
jgi:hypothetical protein